MPNDTTGSRAVAVRVVPAFAPAQMRPRTFSIRRPRWFKQLLFRSYGWLGLMSVVAMLAWSLCHLQSISWQLVTTWLGGTFIFVSAVQKQKLDEVKMFAELFTDFNRRFEELSSGLSRIWAVSDREITPGERETLKRYFDLCAEEFLFWDEELIHPEAWKAWKRGMRFYFAHEHIGALWRDELAKCCYYGLTAAELLRDE
jgi:hypothetical protein